MTSGAKQQSALAIAERPTLQVGGNGVGRFFLVGKADIKAIASTFIPGLDLPQKFAEFGFMPFGDRQMDAAGSLRVTHQSGCLYELLLQCGTRLGSIAVEWNQRLRQPGIV